MYTADDVKIYINGHEFTWADDERLSLDKQKSITLDCSEDFWDTVWGEDVTKERKRSEKPWYRKERW